MIIYANAIRSAGGIFLVSNCKPDLFFDGITGCSGLESSKSEKPLKDERSWVDIAIFRDKSGRKTQGVEFRET